MKSTKEKSFPPTTACTEYHFNSHRARLKRQKKCKLQAFFMLACINFIRTITTRSETGVEGHPPVTHTFYDLSNWRLQKIQKGIPNKGSTKEKWRFKVDDDDEELSIVVEEGAGGKYWLPGDRRGLGQKVETCWKAFFFRCCFPLSFPEISGSIRLRELSSFETSSSFARLSFLKRKFSDYTFHIFRRNLHWNRVRNASLRVSLDSRTLLMNKHKKVNVGDVMRENERGGDEPIGLLRK